ncbi:hypothetical protein CVT27_27905 [Streptomyces cavourensis]|nr:hypothetical protein CVT27_27905 [Streptomyces cavourensis]
MTGTLMAPDRSLCTRITRTREMGEIGARAGKSVDATGSGRAKVGRDRTTGEPVPANRSRNQEVRTLMTVVAVGTAHDPKSIVPTPVATG